MTQFYKKLKNIELFPAFNQIRRYQLKCAALLTSVPLICSAALTGLLFVFAQLNLYYLENGGMPVNEAIRTAYHAQVQMELLDFAWIVLILFIATFVASYLMMGWAVSPFVNAEKVLRKALSSRKGKLEENDWLSESPVFHNLIWGFAQRLKDENHNFDKVGTPVYRFNFRFFIKFILGFYAISIGTGYITGMILNVVYAKIVNLAINLVRMNERGHYFLAQEDLLRTGSRIMIGLSCLTFLIMGYYITRYMSNMIFVFSRALKEHHFPLKLRDSDIYHDLASAISDVAEECGLSRETKKVI